MAPLFGSLDHEFLPALREDNDVYTTVMGTMSYPSRGRPRHWRSTTSKAPKRRVASRASGIPSPVPRDGPGGHCRGIRLFRRPPYFGDVLQRLQPPVRQRGVRGRRAGLPPVVHDTFGHVQDGCSSSAPGVRYRYRRHGGRARWVADHGFHGTYPPGFLNYPGVQTPIVRHLLGAGLERSAKTAACRCSSTPVSGRSKGKGCRRSPGSSPRSIGSGGSTDEVLVTRLRNEELFGADFLSTCHPAGRCGSSCWAVSSIATRT